MSSVSMRRMEPRDVAAVLRLAAEQNERDGTSYPVPQVFDGHGRLLENMPLALVTEVDGQVAQAELFQRTVEMMCFGVSRRATAFSRHEMGRAAYLLGLHGYEGVHVQIPHARVGQLESTLGRAGFGRDDDRFAHFFRSLL